MTKKEKEKELKRLLTVDPKTLYDKPVTVKFNTYEYQMLKELSDMINQPISRIIRYMVFNSLMELKEIDKIK